MTLPTNTTLNAADDDSDMFGPPRTSPLRHTRPRVPMISAKLRLREERKRILQLCAHKLERIKDSETNLRRSVCINNTYSRLTDELRREKQSRYLANLPKWVLVILLLLNKSYEAAKFTPYSISFAFIQLSNSISSNMFSQSVSLSVRVAFGSSWIC